VTVLRLTKTYDLVVGEKCDCAVLGKVDLFELEVVFEWMVVWTAEVSLISSLVDAVSCLNFIADLLQNLLAKSRF